MGSTAHDRATAIEEAIARGEDPREPIAALREELPARPRKLERFAIMHHAVSQDAYARYVYASGAPEPWVDPTTWSRTPHADHERVSAVAWREGKPQAELADAPAVLVSQPEAAAYCAWWGEHNGGSGHLPSEAQWERAMQDAAIVVGEWTETTDGDAIVVKGGTTTIAGRPAHRRPVPAAVRHVAIGFRCVFEPD